MHSKKFSYSIDNSEINNISRICVIAWGLIGDVFIRVPVIEALRKRFPDSEITVIVESLTRPVFEYNPAVDHVFVINRKKQPLLQYVASTLKNIIKLRKYKYDLVIDLYGGGSSPTISRLSKAKIILGFDHKKKLRKSYNLLVKQPDFCRQWILDFGKMLKPLGVDEKNIRVGTTFIYPNADSKVIEHFFQDDKRYFCINLGARDPVKCWPIDKYVELAKRINKAQGLIPMVLTNPGQEELAQEFMQKYQGEAVNPPVLPLGQVGALMDRCLFTITGDTSLMHMSFGLHKPTLVLFAYTRPEWHIVDDCKIEYCFNENPVSKYWRCGKPWGDKNISVSQAFDKAEKLIADINI